MKSVIKALHGIRILRSVAKWVLRGVAIPVRYRGKPLFLNAVEHSWAWTGDVSYDTFDSALQDALIELVVDRSVMIDVGCNVGVMTVVALEANEKLWCLSVDANGSVLRLLERTLRVRKLSERCETLRCAVAEGEGEVRFDPSGSVTGHISDAGATVTCVTLDGLIRRFPGQRLLVKMDIEGYEARVVQQLRFVEDRRNLILLVEVHPAGFNGVGDPNAVLEELRAVGGIVCYVGSEVFVDALPHDQFSQVVVRWA